MYRHFYRPYYYTRHYAPYRHCYGYYCMPYNNFINSNYASSRQNIYNTGIINDVMQQSIISQTPSLWNVELNPPVWEGTGQAIIPDIEP